MAPKPKSKTAKDDGTGRSAADYEMGRVDERVVSAPLDHGHDYAPREHEHAYNDFAYKDHAHPYALEGHEHSAVPSHEHDPHDHPVPRHEHGDLLGHLRGAVRALLNVIETGSVNSEQRKAIHAVRVIVGDAHGTVCAHENVAYEQGDVLICQDCRTVLSEPSG